MNKPIVKIYSPSQIQAVGLSGKILAGVLKALKKEGLRVGVLCNIYTKETSQNPDEKEAEEDIKAGRVYRLNRAEDLDKSLQDLAR